MLSMCTECSDNNYRLRADGAQLLLGDQLTRRVVPRDVGSRTCSKYLELEAQNRQQPFQF